LLGDVTVATNITLTILPGTTIQSDAGRDSQKSGANPNRIELIVAGSLNAVGTESQPIVFTSWPPSPATPPQRGDWHGIRLVGGADQVLNLSHCTVEFAVNGVGVETTVGAPLRSLVVRSNECGLAVSRPIALVDSTAEGNGVGVQLLAQTSVALTNTTIAGSDGYGLMISSKDAGESRLVAQGCRILSNGSGAIADFAHVVFADGIIRSNGLNGLYGIFGPVQLEISDSLLEGNGRSYIPTCKAVRTVFRGNRGGGSAALLVGAECTFEECSFTENSQGPALAVAGYTNPRDIQVSVVRCTFEGNPSGGFLCGGSLVMRDCTVRGNGTYGVNARFLEEFSDCIVANNSGPGLLIDRSVGPVGIRGNTIENNRAGLAITSLTAIDAGLIVSNCVQRNSEFQLRNDGTNSITANGNYWGENTTAELVAGVRNLAEIRDSYDDPKVGPVYIESYLGTCPCPGVPVLSVQPVDVIAPEGGKATFTVAASGLNLAYQWFHSGAAVAGATSPTLSLSPVSSADGGEYYAVVRTACGSLSSSSARLTVLQPPRILSGPVLTPSPVPLGQTARLHVDATGAPPLTCRWARNGAAVVDGGRISGATGLDLAISATQAGDAGNYSVTISNSVGSVTSAAVALTIVFPPAITRAPTNILVTSGGDAVFSVEVNGTPPFTYVWSLNGRPIAGEIGPFLTVRNAQPAQLGAYTVAVANAAGQDDTLKLDQPAYLYLSDLKMYSGIVLAGPVGGRVRIDVAPRVAEPVVWQVWTNVVLETSPQVIIDFNSADQPERYYRPQLAP